MSKSLALPLAFVALLTVTSYAQKFGYCNSTTLLADLPEVKAADSDLKDFQAYLTKRGQEMVKVLQDKTAELDKKRESGTISSKSYDEQAAKLTEEEKLIQDYEQEIYAKVGERRETLFKPILDKVNNAMKEIAIENNFNYIFDNNDGLLLYADESLDVTKLMMEKLTPRPKRPPTVHLLSVGIGVYQQDFMFNHLDFAVPGAFLVKGVYERRNLVQRGTPLNGASATKTNILRELEKLTDRSKVQNDDLVIFFYSGHGTMSGGKIGICPWDYQSAADIIEDKTITAILDRCPARHKACFIEACKNENSADVISAEELSRFNEGRRSLAAGTVFLTSTEVGQKSWGNAADGGFFTKALLEGFDDGKADANNDRNVTAQELFNYVQKRVKELTNGKQVPQINSGYPKDLVIMRLGSN